MLRNLSKNKKGFTIIEVLIVLAIAGLILLIVFLAVPNLQRNSRNTQKRSDVNVIAAAVNEFLTTNNGSLPTTFASKSVSGGATTTAVNANTTYYTTGTITGTAAQNALTTDVVQIVTGAKCGASGATVAGTTRQVAIQFMIETASNPKLPQCIVF